MDFKRIRQFDPPLATALKTIQAYSTTNGKKDYPFGLRMQNPKAKTA